MITVEIDFSMVVVVGTLVGIIVVVAPQAVGVVVVIALLMYSVKFAINSDMLHGSAIIGWKKTMFLLFLHLLHLPLLRPKLLQLKLFSGHLFCLH